MGAAGSQWSSAADVHRVRLIELGPVAMPAYGDTTVTARDAIAERNRLRVSLERARLDAELSDAKAWRP